MSVFERRQFLQMMAVVSAAPLMPNAFAQSPLPRDLLLVEKDAAAVSFYELATGKSAGRVQLQTQPHEIAYEAARQVAYVAQYGVTKWAGPGEGGHQVFVIDVRARTLARTIDLSPYHRLHGIRLDAQGRLYVLSETDSVLIRLDHPAQSDLPSQVVPVGGTRSHYFVIRRDGSRAYVCDTLSGMVIMLAPHDPLFQPVKRAAGAAPEGCCLSPDEQRFYAIDRYRGELLLFDAVSFKLLRRQAMRGEAVRVVALASGKLVVSNAADKSLSLLSADSLAEEKRLPLPAGAPGLNLMPGEQHLYASLDNNQVAVVNLLQWRVESVFATQGGPDAGVFV